MRHTPCGCVPYVEGANNGCRTCPHSTGEIFEYQQAMTLLWLAFFLFYGSNAFMNVVIRVKFDGYSLKKEGKKRIFITTP